MPTDVPLKPRSPYSFECLDFITAFSFPSHSMFGVMSNQYLGVPYMIVTVYLLQNLRAARRPAAPLQEGRHAVPCAREVHQCGTIGRGLRYRLGI